MGSARFKELDKRVDELRRLLLPARFDPTGTYKDPLRVTTRAVSFRVLAHAEVETYFEDRVLEIAKTSLEAWEERNFVSVVSFHLLGFSGQATERPPETLTTTDQNKAKDWPNKICIDDRFSRCVSDFNRRVRKENHGVKEKNILELLLPIGFDMSKCDAIFLQTMSTFGEARGAVAHTSGSTHVQKAVDPSDEYKILRTIVSSLAPIDEEMDRLLKAAAPAQAQ